MDVKITNKTALQHLNSYLDQRTPNPTNSSPLFAKRDNTPLTRADLLSALAKMVSEAKINTSGTSGFSFRRGGATSLEIAGVSDRLIKILGRWESWSYARYIDTPIQHLIDAGANL